MTDHTSDWARPDGVEAPFARDPAEPPVYAPPPPTAPAPDVAAAYRRPAGTPDPAAPFDPPPSHRVAPGPASRPTVLPSEAAAYRPTRANTDGFDPAPGDRVTARAEPESPWWVEGAERDPWRDPAAPFGLGRPAVFVEGRPVPDLADVGSGDDVDAPAAEPEPDGGKGRVLRGRFGLSGLLVAVLVALLAGAAGGGAGYLLADRANGIVTDSGATLGTAGSPANRPPGSVADIARRVTPAVVSIQVRTTSEVGTGSGVVVSKVGDGAYILTNNHVVSLVAGGTGDGSSLKATFTDGDVADATIVGRDTLTDLAVVKVAKTDVTVASLGDSDQVAVGDPVLAIGSSLGLTGSVTEGIVSALHRPVRLQGEGSDTNAVIDAIQTDAAINPGNSGGPLVDAAGAVVGINSAIASTGDTGSGGNIGVGFAIPVNAARTVAQELIRTGAATHPTLGVAARSVTDGTRDGAYILQVSPGGPAAAAGLKEADVVVEVGDVSIGSADELTVAVQDHAPGDRVTLGFYRGGTLATATVTLGTA